MKIRKKSNLLLLSVLTYSTAASIHAAEGTPPQPPQQFSTTSTPTPASEGEKFAIKGVKNWSGQFEFTAPVVPLNSPDSEAERVRFSSTPFPVAYELNTNNQPFPALDLQNPPSCQRFYRRLEEYVRRLTISKRSYKYTCLYNGQSKFIIRKPPGQSPLPCQLYACNFIPNYSTGMLDFKLEVFIGPREQNIKLDNITYKIPNLPSFLIPFQETQGTQDGTVVCTKEEGSVVLANGGTRKYTLPMVPSTGNHDLLTFHEEVVACYQPSTQEYKGSCFAAIFQKNLPAAELEILESCSDDEGEFGSVSAGGYYEPSSYSETDGDAPPPASIRDRPLVQDPHKFYKIEGEATEVPAQHNPFMLLDKNRQSYYTRAFQITCYLLIKGVIDRSEPYILQWFLKSEVMGGNHTCSQGGIGLRWTIFDEENFRLYPRDFQSQSLDKAILARDILKIRSDQYNNSSASYNGQYILPADLVNHPQYSSIIQYYLSSHQGPRSDDPLWFSLITDFKSVFLKNSPTISIKILKGIWDQGYYPIMAEVLKESPVHNLEILFDSNKNNILDGNFLTTLKSLTNLTYLKMHGSRLVHHLLTRQSCREKEQIFDALPPTIQFLDLSTTGSSGNEMYFNVPLEQALPNLQKVFLGNKEEIDMSVFRSVGMLLEIAPQLQELQLSYSFKDHPCAHQSGYYTCPKGDPYPPGNDWVHRSMYSSTVFETNKSHVRDVFGVVLKKHPNLRVLTLNIKSRIPKGADVTSYYGEPSYTYHVTPRSEHRLWTHLNNLIAELKNSRIRITVN